MKLQEFIEKYICANTVIRLWMYGRTGHKLIWDGKNECCMEWEVLKDKSYQAGYKSYEVVGVTDILCDTHVDAVNIVIKDDLGEEEKLYLADLINKEMRRLDEDMHSVRYPKEVGEELSVYQSIAKKLGIEWED